MLVPESKMNEVNLNFFVRGKMLIPYLEMDLQDLGAVIKGINLGPYASNELNKYSVKDLLKINKLNAVSINCSKVPIRDYS